MIFRKAKMAVLESVLDQGEQPVPGRSLSQDAFARLRRNKAAVVSLFLLLLLIVLAVAGPWFLPHNYEDPDWAAFRAPPSLADGHWFRMVVTCLPGPCSEHGYPCWSRWWPRWCRSLSVSAMAQSQATSAVGSIRP